MNTPVFMEKCGKFSLNYHQVSTLSVSLLYYSFEPRHDKTNKVPVRPAKAQISLGNRPVWSESSLSAHWVAKDPIFLHADGEDSDQTGRMPRLIWCLRWAHTHFVGFVMLWLIFSSFKNVQVFVIIYMSHLMRKETLEVCCLKSFKCACPATQKARGCGSLSEAYSNSLYCVIK